MIKSITAKLSLLFLLIAITTCYYERETDQLKVCYVKSGSIWIMNIDGSDQKNLTNSLGTDFSPSWSPDGEKILFESNRDGNFEIYVINSDGSGLKQLTHTSIGDNQHPTWFSDGERIAFKYTNSTIGQIVIADTNGNIINTYDPFGTQYKYPTLSPDNNFIYFTEDDTASRFFELNLVTNTFQNYGSKEYSSISCSPDGKTIACTYNSVDIYLVPTTNLSTFAPDYVFPSSSNPCWTPDSKIIIYVSTNDYNIWRINNDGTNIKPLTTGGGCSAPCVQGKPR